MSYTTGGSIELLKSGSGQTTNAAAENVDTVAISGLTAVDRLLIIVAWEAVTQQTASVKITDDGVADLINAVTVAAGGNFTQLGIITRRQGSTTEFQTITAAFNVVTDVGGANGGTMSTWTGSWTLALRHGGVTAGGTGKWTWSVYKLKGQ